MFHRASMYLLVLLVTMSSVASVSAQGTPPSEELDVPSAGECWVPPVSILSILSMLNKVEAAQYMGPMRSVYLSDVERGGSLSLEDSTGIEETNRQLVACANAVSPLQIMALLDEYFQARLIVEGMDDDGIDALVSQLPMLATQTADTQGIVALTTVDAWYAPGTTKQIMAVVQPYVEDPSKQVQFLVLYLYSIDHWLISNVLLIEE